MAKTIQEHYDMIVAAKQGASDLDGYTPLGDSYQQLLADMNSGSKVALWRLWCYVLAFVSWFNEVAFEKHKQEVDELIASRMYGVLRFYHQVCLDFQYGDQIAWNGKQYAYADTTSAAAAAKRIIERAAVVNNQGVLQFKVAKLSGEKPIPLTSGEQTALQSYLNDLVYPGSNFVIISEAADDLRLSVTIYYDAQHINPDGSSISDSSVFPVDDAINAFVSSLPFNGRMNVQKLVDTVQGVPGVEDVELHSVESRHGALAFVPVVREVIPFAGHMILTNDSTISYQQYA